MNDPERPPSTNAFVVRFWRSAASGPGESGRWYGHVEHVQSGRRRAFRDLDQMLRFMLEYVEAALDQGNDLPTISPGSGNAASAREPEGE